MAEAHHSTCLNCDHPIADEAFCPACGQRTQLPRITFRETIADFFSSSFSLEGPFLRTLLMLFRNPGQLFRDFLSGKRKRYYKPVPFFIVNTVIYLLLQSIIGYDPLGSSNIQLTYDDQPTLVNQTAEAAQLMVGYINHILLFLVASMGLMLKLFFRKRYHLAEYVAVAFFIIVIPLMRLAALIYAVGPLARGAKPRHLAHAAFRLAERLRPWSMAEIFMVGVTVALIKVAGLATVTIGPAFWAFAGLVVITVLKDQMIDRYSIWEALDHTRR